MEKVLSISFVRVLILLNLEYKNYMTEVEISFILSESLQVTSFII